METMNHSLIKKEKLFFDCANSIGFFKCFGCPRFKSCNLIDLHNHLRARHTLFTFKKKPIFKCRTCSFQTFSEFLFSKHQIVNVCVKIQSFAEKTKKCEHCPFTTTTSRNLKHHILVNHTDSAKILRFECEHCSYKFKTKRNFKRHVDSIHGNQENLKCNHCTFTTKYINSLQQHILRKHTAPEEIQWFGCEHCSVQTKTKLDLKRHIDRFHGNVERHQSPFETKISSSLKRFPCAQCTYRCKTEGGLTYHMHSYHGVPKQLKCEHCPFETKSKSNLEVHVLRKHADRVEIQWFHCEHCPYKSPIKQNWRKHTLRMHNEAYY